MKKIFVVGDIHGCHQSLLMLLDRIKPDFEEDCLLFLGDYIDRGTGSMQVVEEILRLRKEMRHVITLMGNHEQMLLNYLAGRDKGMFLEVGGIPTLESYGVNSPYDIGEAQERIPRKHQLFFNELLTSWESESHIFVHAGLQPGVHLSQQSRQWLLWGRERYLSSQPDFGKPVVSGHTPFREPLVEENRIIIDTGAVYGGKLTCLILPDMEFVQVPGESHWQASWRDG